MNYDLAQSSCMAVASQYLQQSLRPGVYNAADHYQILGLRPCCTEGELRHRMNKLEAALMSDEATAKVVEFMRSATCTLPDGCTLQDCFSIDEMAWLDSVVCLGLNA